MRYRTNDTRLKQLKPIIAFFLKSDTVSSLLGFLMIRFCTNPKSEKFASSVDFLQLIIKIFYLPLYWDSPGQKIKRVTHILTPSTKYFCTKEMIQYGKICTNKRAKLQISYSNSVPSKELQIRYFLGCLHGATPIKDLFRYQHPASESRSPYRASRYTVSASR